MAHMQKITPFLWFNDQAEEAVNFYTSLFENARIKNITRYDAGSAQASGRAEGSVMTASFELEGMEFVALNGGPHFKFTEAVSFVVNCESQDEVDHFWNRLTENGGQESMCGWLKDRFGLSWQIVPTALPRLLASKDPGKSQRVMQKMMQMKKINIEVLETA